MFKNILKYNSGYKIKCRISWSYSHLIYKTFLYIIELFTPLKVKINEIPKDFKNIIISNDKYTYNNYVDNEILNKIVFELMNILDDILNKII